MSDWDVRDDEDDVLDFIAALRRPIMGRNLCMPRSALAGLSL